MSHKNDENHALTPHDLVLILAIAGRIDAQSRIIAKQLHKGRQVYYAYSVLDSLSSSYSMFKYFFDLCIGGNNDAMHDAMLSPAGVITVVAESVFLVGFSFLACRFEDEQKDEFKKFIATAWPYFRTVMKGLKNAYKGWRSSVQAFHLLGMTDIRYLIAPIGLLLGILAAINRALLLWMVEARKVSMANNALLFNEIKAKQTITLEKIRDSLKAIQESEQSLALRRASFVGVAAGGFIDGLYLYVGVLTLTALSPPLLIAMSAISAFYTLACVVTRLYEEYDFQLRLMITHTKIRLMVTTRQLELSYAHLFLRSLHGNDNNESDLDALRKEVSDLILAFGTQRELLSGQLARTYFLAALLGIKNGLYAYGALASVLFLVGSVLFLCGVAFPPALLVVSVTLGLVFMMGFLIASLVKTYRDTHAPDADENGVYSQLQEFGEGLQLCQKAAALLDVDCFYAALKDGLFLKSPPQHYFQEWFEVWRSLFSGLGKGQKFVDFAGNPLQESDDQGHYHDTPMMYVLGLLSALLFGIILALRALAKGFRPQLGQVDLVEDTFKKPLLQANSTPETYEEIAVLSQGTKTTGEPAVVAREETDSPRSTNLYNFFALSSEASGSMKRVGSGISLNIVTGNNATQPPNTVVGLT